MSSLGDPVLYDILYQYLQDNLPRYISELGSICARPPVLGKISAGNDAEGILQIISNLCREQRLQVESYGSGNKSVLVVKSEPHPGQPTLISYNTFVVKKTNQDDEWRSAMFGLNEHNGKLYAPGVSDNRANLVARLAALNAWREIYSNVPVNMVFIIEARSGKPGSAILELLGENHNFKNAGACLWDSGETAMDGTPVIGLGQKGLLAVELRSKTLQQAGDSALSGIIPSGGWRLIWALSAIKNDNEDILIDGFDQDINVPTHEDSAFLFKAASRFTERVRARREHYGLDEYLMGLEGLPLLITEFFTPTANIIGFNGGYTGEGYKPLLMSGGSVKVDFRLVPDQQPDEILELLKKHLNRRGFTDIEVEQVGDSESPARTSPNHPFVQTALLSMEHATRQPPLVVPLGPTVGPMKAFKQYLNDLPIICAGTYYDGAMPDTPDENIRVSDFFNHMKFTTRLLGQMAENAAVISPGSSSAPENTVKPEG